MLVTPRHCGSSTSLIGASRRFSTGARATTRQPRVAIIGGGISGLSLAHSLQPERGSAVEPQVSVLERNAFFGGWAQTRGVDGGDGGDAEFLFEQGPRSLRFSKSTLSLVSELGLDDHIVLADKTAARRRLLYLDGELTQVPPGRRNGLFSRLTFELARAITREVFVGKNSASDETFDQFFRRRFSPYLAERLVGAMCLGVWAGNSERLSIRSCLPAFWRLEQEHGSLFRGALAGRSLAKDDGEPDDPEASELIERMRTAGVYSFERGLSTLVDGLVEALDEETDATLQSNAAVERIRLLADASVELTLAGGESVVHADHVFSTIALPQIATLLPYAESRASSAGAASELRALLEQVEYASVAVVNVAYRQSLESLFASAGERAAKAYPGFGYLVPPREQQSVIGVTFDSIVFPQHNRTPDEARMTVMVGGDVSLASRNSAALDVCAIDPASIEQAALGGLAEQLGVTVDPAFVATHVHRHAIPQCTLGHHERIERITALSRECFPWLTLIGTAFDGVGVNDCVALSRRTARDWLSKSIANLPR